MSAPWLWSEYIKLLESFTCIISCSCSFLAIAFFFLFYSCPFVLWFVAAQWSRLRFVLCTMAYKFVFQNISEHRFYVNRVSLECLIFGIFPINPTKFIVDEHSIHRTLASYSVLLENGWIKPCHVNSLIEMCLSARRSACCPFYWHVIFSQNMTTALISTANTNQSLLAPPVNMTKNFVMPMGTQSNFDTSKCARSWSTSMRQKDKSQKEKDKIANWFVRENSISLCSNIKI